MKVAAQTKASRICGIALSCALSQTVWNSAGQGIGCSSTAALAQAGTSYGELAQVLSDRTLRLLAAGDFETADATAREMRSVAESDRNVPAERKARARDFADDVSSLVHLGSKKADPVKAVAMARLRAFDALDRSHLDVARFHAQVACETLEELGLETTSIYCDMINVAAITTGPEEQQSPWLRKRRSEYQKVVRSKWGEESWQYATAEMLRIYAELLAGRERPDLLPALARAARQHEALLYRTSTEYLATIRMQVAVLHAMRKDKAAVEICNSALAKVKMDRPLDRTELAQVFALAEERAVILYALGEQTSALNDLREARRHTYGTRETFADVDPVIAVYRDAAPHLPPEDPASRPDWLARKFKEAIVTVREFDHVAGNWISTGLLSSEEWSQLLALQKRTDRMQVSLCDGQVAAAAASLRRMDSLVTAMPRFIDAECCDDWLVRDLNRFAESSSIRRAVSATWRAFANDPAALREIRKKFHVMRCAITDSAGADSASLWYFERALAKAHREHGQWDAAEEALIRSRAVLRESGRWEGPLGIAQSADEIALAALRGNAAADRSDWILGHEVSLGQSIGSLKVNSRLWISLGLFCLAEGDYDGAYFCGDFADFVGVHEHLKHLAGPDFTPTLVLAIRAAAYAHFGETEAAAAKFAEVKVILDQGREEGIRAPELRWFALKLYADFLESEGKTIRAKSIRRQAEDQFLRDE